MPGAASSTPSLSPDQFAALPTEQPRRSRRGLDQLSTRRLLHLINREDALVPRAVRAALPAIEAAVDRLVAAVEAGGRLWFVGAGTSGRLGVLEAAECPPTFNTPPELVQAVIAGGPGAVFQSVEGAEDDAAAGRRAARAVRRGDAVVGIAASGVTRFVHAALQSATRRGAATILLTCHRDLAPPAWVDVLIRVPVPPEVIAGSTRLKAGTATKLALNMLTVAAMVRLGKVYDRWMVDLRPTSRKLRARAVRIIQTVAGVPAEAAAAALRQAGGRVKPAILIAAHGVDLAEADRRLAQARGRLRPVLAALRRRR
jgi:N-acetylmuramic acid 6-phosphate etherase